MAAARLHYGLALPIIFVALTLPGRSAVQSASEAAAIQESKHYTVDGLYGERYRFSWVREPWFGPIIEDGNVGPDPIGAQLAPLLAAVPALAFSVPEALASVGIVTLNHGRDLERKWTFDTSNRIVERFEQRFRTAFVHDSTQLYAYADDLVCLSGSAASDVLLYTKERKSIGVKSLGADVLYPFPETSASGTTWLQAQAWTATVAEVGGRQRVSLVAQGGFGGDPTAEYSVLFERQLGALVPIVQFQRDELGTGLTLFEYAAVQLSSGGAVPFPAEVCSIESYPDGSLKLVRGTLQYLGAPVSGDELRVPIRSSCSLSFHPTLLPPDERLTVRPADQLTWPIRVLAAVVVQ
ncbi:MAG: hypothetical protein R3F49_05615 [Planctomycetota bacterium]